MHALGMRAKSMGASVLLVGAALVLALSASYTVQQLAPPIDGSPPITMARPPVDPPPPVTRNDPPPMGPIVPTTFIDASPVDPLAPQEGTMVPTSFGGAGGVVEITDAYWRRHPTDLSRFYPQRAITRNMEGRAELDCAVSTAGWLTCTVISEAPANWGFGEAALRISREYQMVPASRDGQPTQGRYHMVVPFTLR